MASQTNASQNGGFYVEKNVSMASVIVLVAYATASVWWGATTTSKVDSIEKSIVAAEARYYTVTAADFELKHLYKDIARLQGKQIELSKSLDEVRDRITRLEMAR